ncbi:maleylpyruvate isomerase family mycothiol-dependent enzyme [Paenarthrobacter sp. DKR-5]|uniref:maleylpyruvate isomerase family mycothiol-dependent enzyme n=1 Tax=Paenarthrobacter sp. DKR-5 TaxID=2835535 RepID=UPI001BDCE5DB|nr:maleylpyruvate isomerase family mycothiol-dependent enzyme [Paenarthrobacter sp. DKR-5]MBT1003738.1 maleylpyruvate isomerase family mycothiol-dependent enzyme [Paenarthrobacter sp. DKR-5]
MRQPLSAAAYLASLAGSIALLRDAAGRADALGNPVPACPGWNLGALLGHVGSIERWVAGVLASGAPAPEPEPPAGAEAAWFLDGTDVFLAAMADVDPNRECWNFGPRPRTAGFWLRRQAHEHLIHAWDAAAAAGEEAPPVSQDLALDGTDEVLTMFLPRQLRLGQLQPVAAAVRFETPGGDAWTVGEGPVRAVVSAPAPELYLGLWHRSDLASKGRIEGNQAAAAALLRAPVVP